MTEPRRPRGRHPGSAGARPVHPVGALHLLLPALLLGLTTEVVAGQDLPDGHGPSAAMAHSPASVTPMIPADLAGPAPDRLAVQPHPHPLLPLLAMDAGPLAMEPGPPAVEPEPPAVDARPPAMEPGPPPSMEAERPGTPLSSRWGQGTAQERLDSGPGAGSSFLASLVVPGASQWMRGQRRAWIYVGVELLGWAFFAQGRSQGARFREDYRDLAWRIARVNKDLSRVDGDFRYYEAVGAYPASGAWDADPQAEGLQPETDPGTYNGMIWSLARDLYLTGEDASDPEDLQRALEYYQERGFPPELAWEWHGNDSRRAEYRHLIERSDDGFRRATVFLGAVVANHLLSAVDGYISARIIAERAPSSSPSRILRRGRPPPRWTLELRLDRLP